MRNVFLFVIAVLGMVMTGCARDEFDFGVTSNGVEVSEAGTKTWMNVNGVHYETMLALPQGLEMEVPEAVTITNKEIFVSEGVLSADEEVVAEKSNGVYTYRTVKARIDVLLEDMTVPVYFLQEKAFLKASAAEEYVFPSPKTVFKVRAESETLKNEVIDERLYVCLRVTLKAEISPEGLSSPVESSTGLTVMIPTNVYFEDPEEIDDEIVISF